MKQLLFPFPVLLLWSLLALPAAGQGAGDVIRLLDSVVRELDRPNAAPAPDYRQPLPQGQVYVPPRTASRADQVREVQAALNRLGYPAGPVDGVMGPSTRSALAAFQRAQGLPADGRIGPATLAALRGGSSGRPAAGNLANTATAARTGSLTGTYCEGGHEVSIRELSADRIEFSMLSVQNEGFSCSVGGVADRQGATWRWDDPENACSIVLDLRNGIEFSTLPGRPCRGTHCGHRAYIDAVRLGPGSKVPGSERSAMADPHQIYCQ